MLLLNNKTPIVYLHNNKKYIKTKELQKKYSSYTNYPKELISIIMDFLTSTINEWNVVQFLGKEIIDNEEYCVFSYDKNLKHLNQSDFEDEELVLNFLKLKYHLYQKAVQSRFQCDGMDLCFCPVDATTRNFMYNKDTKEFTMVDVDSFNIVPFNEVFRVLEIEVN